MFHEKKPQNKTEKVAEGSSHVKTGLIFTQLERHSRKMNRKVRLQRSKLLLLADNKTVFEQLRVIQSRYSAWRTDHAHRKPRSCRRIRTCDDVPVSVLHAVLVLLGRIPRCRLSLKEALKRRESTAEDWESAKLLRSSACKKTAIAEKQKRTGERRQGGGSRCHSQPLPPSPLHAAAPVWLPRLKVSVSSSLGGGEK